MADEELALTESLLKEPTITTDEYNTLTDDTITDEQISEFKALGIPKPPLVKWPRWMGPKDIKQKNQLLVHLAATGKTNIQIANELDMNPTRVSIIINTPHIQEAIKAKRHEYYGEDARARFKSLTDKSYQVFDNILTNDKEKSNVRLSAATYIADQAIGKAQQTLTVGGSLLIDLITRLDTQPARDVAAEHDLGSSNYTEASLEEQKTIAVPKDAVDNFVDALELEEITIGKRS